MRLAALAWASAALALVPAGCGAAARLRVKNVGGPVSGLVVLFPDDEVEFGDVAAGATTEYRSAPSGVYRLAAYRVEVAGRPRTQPVKCWVGETPLADGAYTYVIDFDASRTDFDRVRLESVTRDE
jgi:hypothetical protein